MHPQPSSSFRQHHVGLTLVELLVVLSIIAVLSTVALRSVVGTLDQQNYEANVDQLEEIEKAVLGDSEAGGFLGDIGRLPAAVGDAGAANLEQLAELWDQSASGLPDYAIGTANGDGEIRLGTGWRGPYLDLGITRSDLTDAFANRFLLYQADGTTSDDTDSIAIVQSLGADDAAGGTDYNEDFEVLFQADTGAVTAGLADAATNRWQQDVEVIVERDGGDIEVTDGANLIVRAYGANGAGGIHTVREQKVVIATDLPSQTFTLSNLPHGAKILRAYQDSTDPASTETLITTASPERKSPATHVVVDRFTGTITLTLY
ncbi:MAG: prepilin-type N-terminal cleavage/methylation domain-containing protein [Verrucomicrobiota bacterium]